MITPPDDPKLRAKAAEMKQDLRSQEQIAADFMIAEARKAASACPSPSHALALRPLFSLFAAASRSPSAELWSGGARARPQ
jgi:hypothetical protein